MATTDSYRISAKNKIESSSEEGELSSDDDDDITWKDANKDQQALLETNISSQMTKQVGRRRKTNHIWGSVIAEQSTDDISSSLGAAGSQKIMSRGPESFSLELAMKEIHQRQEHMQYSSSEDETPSKTRKTETIEEEMENYMIDRHHVKQKKIKTGHSSNLKRKKPKKSKPGHVPNYKQGQRVTLNKRNEISVDDSEDKVADEIIFRLWEKKRDLVRSLVHCIGVPKALFLYNKTEVLELNGGLMTLQGNRRRTPGGTFLFLVRNDDEVNQSEVNALFEADYLREREQWMAAKQAKKLNKEMAVDVGQTPQNSPQMETIHLSSNQAEIRSVNDTIDEEMDDFETDTKPLSPPADGKKTPDIETFG